MLAFHLWPVLFYRLSFVYTEGLRSSVEYPTKPAKFKRFLQRFFQNVMPLRNLVSGQFLLWQAVLRLAHSVCCQQTYFPGVFPRHHLGHHTGAGCRQDWAMFPVAGFLQSEVCYLQLELFGARSLSRLFWHMSPRVRAKHFLSGLWVDERTGLGRSCDSEGQRSRQQEI